MNAAAAAIVIRLVVTTGDSESDKLRLRPFSRMECKGAMKIILASITVDDAQLRVTASGFYHQVLSAKVEIAIAVPLISSIGKLYRVTFGSCVDTGLNGRQFSRHMNDVGLGIADQTQKNQQRDYPSTPHEHLPMWEL